MSYGICKIQELVLQGRITPEQAVRLIEMRKALEHARKPWWRRALIWLFYVR